MDWSTCQNQREVRNCGTGLFQSRAHGIGLDSWSADILLAPLVLCPNGFPAEHHNFCLHPLRPYKGMLLPHLQCQTFPILQSQLRFFFYLENTKAWFAFSVIIRQILTPASLCLDFLHTLVLNNNTHPLLISALIKPRFYPLWAMLTYTCNQSPSCYITWLHSKFSSKVLIPRLYLYGRMWNLCFHQLWKFAMKK